MARHRTPGQARGAALRSAAALVAACLAGCTEPPPPPQAAAVPPRVATPPQASAAPAPDAATPDVATPGAEPDSEAAQGAPAPVLVQNDPSAPLDTPLCGRAARERIEIGAALEPDVIAQAGACAQTACFDPATDTFIGADGYRHVCQ